MKTCILSLLLEYIFSLFFTREFNVVCARVGGANTTPNLAAHFAKRNTKNCGGEKRSGESECGQKFLPPNPLPFCPPERSVWRAERAVSSAQNRFGFRQTNALRFHFLFRFFLYIIDLCHVIKKYYILFSLSCYSD